METKQFNKILAEVPGTFKAKLDRIRRYLILGKASVMVGAGFSRNADVPSHIRIKQWNDVGEDIYCRMMSVDKVDHSKLEFKTPMRLASQFAALYGRSELDNLIKESIPDDRMNPGTLHHQLLSLPWRDVFTTNYDTLLERSRKGLLRAYSVVTSKEMLLYKKSPRIIKLHGSFPDKTPFLMTEEDFRTYPTEHPEFVNTVRQALVESVFCLIGFSGDDPNFTSWQGWLRDVMGDYAGPSYLITCDKEYDESFKVLMEHRGIQVLNFSEIDGIDNHHIALDFFFTYLSERESDWSGYVQYDSRNISPEELTNQLKTIRQAYPGWFILPKKYFNDFRDVNKIFPFLEEAFKTIEQRDKEALLFELDWRADISLSFKDFDWFRENLEQVVRDYGDKPLSQEAITLGISLLRLYRHHPNKQIEAEELKGRLAKESGRMTQHQQSMFYYTVAGNALSVLDYDSVAETLKNWNPTFSDYAGVIYKALILAETNDSSAATELLNEALDRITQSLTQVTTQEELSLRCVIENLLAFYEGERMPNTDARFSFVDQSELIEHQFSKNRKKPFEITHGFGLGSTHRSWNWDSGTNVELLYPYRFLLLCEHYGIPFGLATRTSNEKILALYLPSITRFGIWYSLGPILRSGSRQITVNSISRNALNTLSRDEADKLAILLLKQSEQTSCEKAREFRAINVLLPFLSRLSSSCSAEIVVNIYKFALSNYCKSNLSKPEDLNIIYDNLMPEGMQDVCETVFSSVIFSDMSEKDIPLPRVGLEYYTPSEKAIDVACNGLMSDCSHIRESSYKRADKLLKSNINEEIRTRLHNSIRKWRQTEAESTHIRNSYRIVAPSDMERTTIIKLAEKDLGLYLSQDYLFKGSSDTVSSLFVALNNLTLDADYLSNNQISTVLEKLADVLDANLDSYSIDDSEDTLGGFRHFTIRVFLAMRDFVKIVHNNGYNESKAPTKLFKVLEKYLHSHLPVRASMVRLNLLGRVIGANKMRDIISEHLFSDNEQDVIDSCNGLVDYIHYNSNFQKVLQNIIFYCNHAESDKIRLYLLTLSKVPLDKMTIITQKLLAEMMKLVLKRMPMQDFSEEQKVDIMHAGVVLAASLKGTPDDSLVANAIKMWEEYAKNDTIYNDIRLPWFVK